MPNIGIVSESKMHNQIEKYCVRVKSNENIGSGVLLPGSGTFYVFTAAHCLGKEMPDVQSISIEKQCDYKSEFSNISAIKIVEFNLEHDFALLEVDFNEEDKLFYEYKLARGFISENGVSFCGYQGVNVEEYRPFTGKVISVSDVSGKFKITLQNDTFDQAGEDGQYLAKGLSGSGVFICRHESIFLLGILNSVITEKAWNDDIECCSIKHLEEYIQEYVDLSDFENLKQWNENIDKKRTEREIEKFKLENIEFFDKLYRKNQVLHPLIDKANNVTVKQIQKYLAMTDNIKTIENNYPLLYQKFKNVVKRFVDQVKDEYSRNVNSDSEAKDLKTQLQNELKHELELLPEFTNIDLSEFQVIEWLGMCTLDFTTND